jgi:hypothetical protein
LTNNLIYFSLAEITLEAQLATVTQRSEILRRLRELRHRGFALIEWWEILDWFGQERVTVGIWRQINEMFEEVCGDDKAPDVHIRDCATGAALLLADGPTKLLSKRI